LSIRDTHHHLFSILLRFTLYFLISAAGVFAFFVTFELQKFSLERSRSQEKEALRLALASRALQSDLREPIRDLRPIAALPALREYLNQEAAATRQRVEQEFLNIAQHQQIYDQIRYIDATGMERVRVNFDGHTAVAVPVAQLQDKSQRYYYREAIGLTANAIYISPLDLNVEQGRIERPFKPMIRLAMPVHDASGQLRGVVVLNYLATTLLDDFKKYMADSWGEPAMVNSQGYWLSSNNPEDEWGFMLGRDETFARRYPEAWAGMVDQESGAVSTPSGLFIFDTVRPYTVNSVADAPPAGELKAHIAERYWKIITRVAPQAVTYSPLSVAYERRNQLAGLLLLVGILSMGLAWLRTYYVANRKALRESNERYRLLFESVAEGVYGVDRSGRCMFVNPAALNMLGYGHSEQLIGKEIHPLIHHTRPNGSPCDKKECRIYRAFREDRDFHADNEWFWRKDGSHFEAEYRSHPIRKDGVVVGSVATFMDISERRKAEQQLQNYREHLEEMVAQRTAALEASYQELESFSYSIAHDLRTPLRSITSFSQILQEEAGPKLTQQEHQDLQRIVKAGKYMAQLIDDILELARISRSEFHIETVNLSGIAEKVSERLQQLDPQRSVQVDIEQGLTCSGDNQLLRIVLENLMENAWKYSANRSDARIEFGMMEQDNDKVFCVRDNGVGFDMQYADKLFKPFQRLHPAGDYEGTGIGLASVLSAVQRHNGKVWAESKPGEGATFYFTLHAFQSNA
jgi:PAS domain S-box-containing protein